MIGELMGTTVLYRETLAGEGGGRRELTAEDAEDAEGRGEQRERR